MKRRRWDARTKAKIVLEGLQGRSVTEICTEYGIGQTQYYRWRDQFFSKAHREFDSEKNSTEVQRLKKKVSRYQQIIDVLTVELKKNRGRVVMWQASESVQKRNEPVVERTCQIKVDHLFWGYRWVWAHLRYVGGLTVNKKRVYRLMKEHRLTARPNRQLRAKRLSSRRKPCPDRPNQWWGIDMTKVMTDSSWVYIVIILDWYSKKIVGHYAGVQATSRHWLAALERALNRQFPDGVRGHDLHLMSDNGSQPISFMFMKACSHLQVHQAFTSVNNPKCNADTERMMRTLKEELLWLREWPRATELTVELEQWVKYYNESYLHAALGYRTPNRVEKTYNLSHKTLLKLA